MVEREHSFGIIPLRLENRVWHVFIVQHRSGGHWGFPKGHQEAGESPKQSAERELVEETGLRVVRYLPHPYLVETYSYDNAHHERIDKQVQLFLAEVTSAVTLQREELIDGKWVLLKDLFDYAHFDSQRTLYRSLFNLLGLKSTAS